MRALILAAGAALALTACSGGTETETNEVDTLAVDNLVIDANTMDPMNATTNMDANLMADPATQNMMMNDLTTNDADTNLANGL